MNYKKLFHDESAFLRETLEARMQDYGFKNMGRMELFLWDLELFLQIQDRFGERVVLKGGAATQFYLPKEAQRTSVDIDMLFIGTETEIDEVLNQIETSIGDGRGLLHFRKHVPKKPKTTLPLFTYYTDIPSVLTATERNVRDNDTQSQELKVEFITQGKKREYSLVSGEDIFAVYSTKKYQVLPLDSLFADKLTTIGRNTIGVQDDRMDEQVKQFYDILMLTQYCRESMNPAEIWIRYKARAEEEWNERANSDGEWEMLKGKAFSLDEVIGDVKNQLQRYGQVDNGEDKELKKAINDFKGLYLNSKVSYAPADVACGASLVRIMYELLVMEEGWSRITELLDTEALLYFPKFSGMEKGKKIREVRDVLIERFGDVSPIPAKILKGKNPQRVFWAVVTLKNMDEIRAVIEEVATSVAMPLK